MNALKHNTILIVEDSPDDFYAVKRGLVGAGMANNIIRCESGEDALQYLRRSGPYERDESVLTPQVILLDLNLPGMSGMELLETIKKDTGSKSIPVIVLTTSDAPEDIDQCYALGASSYIQKPVNLDGFMQALGQLRNYWFEVVLLPRQR